jgi:hypothetical protein
VLPYIFLWTARDQRFVSYSVLLSHGMQLFVQYGVAGRPARTCLDAQPQVTNMATGSFTTLHDHKGKCIQISDGDPTRGHNYVKLWIFWILYSVLYTSWHSAMINGNYVEPISTFAHTEHKTWYALCLCFKQNINCIFWLAENHVGANTGSLMAVVLTTAARLQTIPAVSLHFWSTWDGLLLQESISLSNQKQNGAMNDDFNRSGYTVSNVWMIREQWIGQDAGSTPVVV